jgi:hypothetical protein
MIPDPLAEDLDECEWIIEEAVRSKEYVRSRYDYDGRGGLGGGRGDHRVAHRPSGRRVQGRQGLGVLVASVVEVSERQALRVGEGQAAGGGHQPFDAMPYVMFRGIDVPGQFWPDAVVKYLRGPQTELNKTKSQIAENRNRFGNPSLLKSRQADVDVSRRARESRRVQRHRSERGPVVPPAAGDARLRPGGDRPRRTSAPRDFRSARGHVRAGPAGVTAASAINLLQEQDDTLGAGDQ